MPSTPSLEALLAGYRRFRAGTWPERRALCEELAAEGQRPLAAVIACADSRLDPAAIFDAAPGALFVVRNVANLVPPYQPDAAYHGTSAALEFAVKGLEVTTVIVMGHAQCGGVRALMDGDAGQLGDFVLPWMQIAARARTRACDAPEPDLLTACEHETVKVSLENLRTFPWIAERVASGGLGLLGAYYGIATGVLELLRPDGTFERLE
ncbi:MAG TPA: carbonic anhydrase [Acetobacteraceae bacterium]|nr:carbonic anhydrase [Acetobacteraceae bacterium]